MGFAHTGPQTIKHLKVLKFRMLRTTNVLQGIRQHDWFMAIDLEDAYFHVPIAPHHRPFLRFAFEGRAYQFRVLPFGMSLAPRVFTRFAAAALSTLQGRGMRIFPYLDDWLVCARSRVDALSDLALLIEHVTRLGLTVNYAKSSLTPSQGAVFIGIQLESQLMRAAPSRRRVDDIVQLVQQFRREPHSTVQVFPDAARYAHSGFGGSPLGPAHVTTPPDLDEQPWVASARPQAEIGHSHCRVHEMPTSLEEACTPNPGGLWGPYPLAERF